MATGRIRPATTKTVVVEPEGVILELTKEEAQMLRNILGKFIGNGPTQPVYDALKDLAGFGDGDVQYEEGFYGPRRNTGVLYYMARDNG